MTLQDLQEVFARNASTLFAGFVYVFASASQVLPVLGCLWILVQAFFYLRKEYRKSKARRRWEKAHPDSTYPGDME